MTFAQMDQMAQLAIEREQRLKAYARKHGPNIPEGILNQVANGTIKP